MKRPNISAMGLAMLILLVLGSFGAMAILMDVATIHTTINIEPGPTPQDQADVQVWTNSSKLERMDVQAYTWVEDVQEGESGLTEIYVYNAGDVDLTLNLTTSGLSQPDLKIYWDLEADLIQPGEGITGYVSFLTLGAPAGTYNFDIKIKGEEA